MISDKCKDCMHRKNQYCRAYRFEITSLNPENCKRKKVRCKLCKKVLPKDFDYKKYSYVIIDIESSEIEPHCKECIEILISRSGKLRN